MSQHRMRIPLCKSWMRFTTARRAVKKFTSPRKSDFGNRGIIKPGERRSAEVSYKLVHSTHLRKPLCLQIHFYRK